MESTANQPQKKILVAFDFDHTLIDDNSDLYVRKLAPGGKLPKEIKDLFNTRGWTEYMGAIFKFLHEHGSSPDDMLACMREIPFVAGMVELLEHLADDRYSVVIISDSNSVFIDCIMKAAKLDHVIEKVYTNPAKFNDAGCLTLEYYHTQDWCELSTVNLCKGHILEEHVRTARRRGIAYPIIVYVGDGTNDLCPGLRLNTCDYVFARRKFQLLKKIHQLKKGEMKASVVPWDTGVDLVRVMQKLEV